jgi:hypothetical protein
MRKEKKLGLLIIPDCDGGTLTEAYRYRLLAEAYQLRARLVRGGLARSIPGCVETAGARHAAKGCCEPPVTRAILTVQPDAYP